ncbi:MAG: gas vesicle protein GvpN, partial [Nanoarchaeota archaeon]
KTILALQIAKELGRPVVWINGDESITTSDLIGGYSQVEVNSIRDKYIHNVFKDKDVLKAEWIDNPLTLACKYGYTLVYNEFSRSKAAANNVLLSIFSEGILELPTQFGEERYVKVHPEFRVIFTSNSLEYAGVHRAQDALLDRMAGIYMDYYDQGTETKIIAQQAKIEPKQAAVIATMLRTLREKLPEGSALGTRAGIMVAQALKLTNNFNESSIKQMLGDVLTSKTKNLQHYNEQMKIIRKI